MKSIVTAFALAVALLAPTAPSATASNALHLDFEKSIVDPAGVWAGTVSGDIEGALRTELRSLTERGHLRLVTFDWIVDAGEESFVARLDGTLNTKNGRVAMRGRVIEGAYLGARVQEHGRLVDAATQTFRGSIRIMPAS